MVPPTPSPPPLAADKSGEPVKKIPVKVLKKKMVVKKRTDEEE
jgi:hypothetical protein